MKNENLFMSLEKSIMQAGMKESEKSLMLRNVMRLKDQKLNIMITGATGSGKSSTINALFGADVAKVGVGVDPETTEIKKYQRDNLVFWDTPGLGDGGSTDKRYTKNIVRKLSEKDADGNALIDLVLVILDGGSRDLGTSYELINEVIIPALGKENASRVLVAVNQADMAMKGRNWEAEENKPNPQLEAFLKEKVKSVARRIHEATGVSITPVYYSAGYKEEGGKQNEPYHLSELLHYIVKSIPSEKRKLSEPVAETCEEVAPEGMESFMRMFRQCLAEVESESSSGIGGGFISRVLGGFFGW